MILSGKMIHERIGKDIIIEPLSSLFSDHLHRLRFQTCARFNVRR